MKIIWHFTNPDVFDEKIKEELVEKIKIFHKESLVIFTEYLEIHIINENEKQNENN